MKHYMDNWRKNKMGIIDTIKGCREQATYHWMVTIVAMGLGLIYFICELYSYSTILFIFASWFIIGQRYWNMKEFILRREKR